MREGGRIEATREERVRGGESEENDKEDEREKKRKKYRNEGTSERMTDIS